MKQITQHKNGSVLFDIDRIKQIENELKKKCYARVGILGSKVYEKRREALLTEGGNHKAGKNKAELTNAEIGFVHEYGSFSQKIPARSFLKMPVIMHLPEEKKKLAWAFGKLFQDFKIKEAYKLLGATAERVVQKAFDTSGWGSWAPLKRRKGSPLVDTGQLRKSISSDVVMGAA